MINLYVAIPTVRDWKPEFGVSMIGLTNRLAYLASQKKIKSFYINNKITSNLPKGRQQMLDHALSGGFTHILWIDDDTQFPAEAVEKLLEHDKPWMAVNICRKKKKGGWIATYDGGAIVNSHEKTGIEQIGTMGLGMTLIKLDAIRHVPKPHFEMRYIEEMGEYLGEDLYFLLKCRKAGVEIWTDHDVSKTVSHIGNYGYSGEDLHELPYLLVDTGVDDLNLMEKCA